MTGVQTCALPISSSVRLLWQLLYHLTFLSDSEDASSSIWQMMFGHVIQKAFSTSLDGISTVDTFEASFKSFLTGSQDLKVNLFGLQQDKRSDGNGKNNDVGIAW